MWLSVGGGGPSALLQAGKKTVSERLPQVGSVGSDIMN